MSAKAEVIIVGGGITGCSIAYYLAREGVRVQIIERNAIGSEASGMSPGVLSPLVDMVEPENRDAEAQQSYNELRLESFRLHHHLPQELREETGVDVQYRQAHQLYAAFTESEEQSLKAQIPLGQAVGMHVAWLGREELKSLGAGLSSKVRGALCWYDQAEVESYRLTLAYAQAAESRGASIRQGTVTGIRHQGTRVTGVIVSGGEISADVIVLAMGPWSQIAGLWLGRKVPVKPIRGQLLVLESLGEIPRYLILHGINYVTPKAGGSILIGSTYERVGFRNRVTQAGQTSIIRGALSLLPSLAKTRVVRAVSGLRPVSIDGLPILGRLPGWDNAYVATGNGAAGILLSPVTGRIMADLITRGHTPTAIEAFDPARFEYPKR